MTDSGAWRQALPQSLSIEQVFFALSIVTIIAVILVLFRKVVKDTKVSDSFLSPYLKFAYVSFFKPHTGKADGGQQSALESFYSAQVSACTRLLARSSNPTGVHI